MEGPISITHHTHLNSSGPSRPEESDIAYEGFQRPTSEIHNLSAVRVANMARNLMNRKNVAGFKHLPMIALIPSTAFFPFPSTFPL